jgi:hypothetical protein
LGTARQRLASEKYILVHVHNIFFPSQKSKDTIQNFERKRGGAAHALVLAEIACQGGPHLRE